MCLYSDCKQKKTRNNIKEESKEWKRYWKKHCEYILYGKGVLSLLVFMYVHMEYHLHLKRNIHISPWILKSAYGWKSAFEMMCGRSRKNIPFSPWRKEFYPESIKCPNIKMIQKWTSTNSIYIYNYLNSHSNSPI